MTSIRKNLLVTALVVFVSGCDNPPAGPRTADGKAVETIAVNPSDAAESAAVSDLQSATAIYKQALKVLHAYYVKTGAYDKQIWAEKELANLLGAQTFTFEGAGAPVAPPSESVADINEAAAVEAVLAARRNWQQSLGKLADHYSQKGLNFKLALVKNIQSRFDPIYTYAYFMHAEVPPVDLKPAEVIQEADILFAEALKLHEQGKPLPGVTDYHKQRQSLLKFRQLVDQYPTSTKIAQSAYYIAEIYKEYFDENLRALAWYERAWQWDKHIILPARSQAAFIYDFRMGQRGKAISLYQEVIKYEGFDWNRVRYARQRIKELMEAKD
ncbi:MAG: hypothetical protein SVV80_00715 [Planctomycetota bacterium]|nr:hypothetical protein [Planctomycetota bacterium]